MANKSYGNSGRGHLMSGGERDLELVCAERPMGMEGGPMERDPGGPLYTTSLDDPGIATDPERWRRCAGGISLRVGRSPKGPSGGLHRSPLLPRDIPRLGPSRLCRSVDKRHTLLVI